MHVNRNCTVMTPALHFLAEGLQLTGLEGQTDGKLCSSGEGGRDGNDLPVHTCMCGSAHVCGCMVSGSNAIYLLFTSDSALESSLHAIKHNHLF